MIQRAARQSRILSFDVETREANSDAIPVVISTDAVVEVADGPEILVHSAEAVDLRRAPLPIVAGHGGSQINVGLVDSIDTRDGQLRGLARFGNRPEAAGYREDVLNKIIRSVSVKYARIRARVRGDGVLVTTRWMPTHVAMVAEPADVNAGFFRERDQQDPFVIEQEQAAPVRVIAAGSPTATPAEPKGAIMAEVKETPPAAPVVEEQLFDPSQAESNRKTAILNLCRAAKFEGLAQGFIRAGASLEDVGIGLCKAQEERQKQSPQEVTYLDMGKKETERYSLMRAVRAAANKDWSKAGLELEANKTLSKRLNRIPRSDTAWFVPLDVLMRDIVVPRHGTRDMTVAGVSGSNYLVGTDNLAGSFIDLLRNTSVCLRMGAQRLGGLVGNVTIPKMTAGNTAYWLADEGTQITESQPTIGQLPLAPKNVAALTELSHQLISQSTPDAEQLVLTSIARDLALAVDVGIIRGAGSGGEPQGIVGTGGVGSVSGSSLAAVGIIEFQTDVAANNGLMPGCGYVTTPAVAGDMMVTPEIATVGTFPVWRGNVLEGTMFGFPAMSSNQMATATMLFGHWPSVVLAEWGVLELMTNPFSDFTRGLTAVRGWYTCDVGVRYPAAFSYASSIT